VVYYQYTVNYDCETNKPEQIAQKEECMLRFSDGVEFDTDGEWRIETRYDGVYVVGKGTLIPISDYAEAEKLVKKLKERE
jgi:hypothetical protein